MRKALGEAAASIEIEGVRDSNKQAVTPPTARENAASLQWGTNDGATLLAVDIVEEAARSSSTGAASPPNQQGQPPSSLTAIVALCRCTGSNAVYTSPRASPPVETEAQISGVSTMGASSESADTPVSSSSKGVCVNGRGTAAASDRGSLPCSGSELLVSAVLKSLAVLVGVDGTSQGASPPSTAEMRTSASFSDPWKKRPSEAGHCQPDRLRVCKKSPPPPPRVGDGSDGTGPRAVPATSGVEASSSKAAGAARFNRGIGGRTCENALVDADGRRRLLFGGVLALLQELFEKEDQEQAAENGGEGETGSVSGAGVGDCLQGSGQRGQSEVWVSEVAKRDDKF